MSFNPNQYGNLHFPERYNKYMEPTYYGVIPAELCEVNGTRSETYTSTEFSAHVEYYCAWHLRYECVEYLRKAIYNAIPTNFTMQEIGTSINAHTGKMNYASSVVLDTILTNNYYSYYLPAKPTSISVSVLSPEGVTVKPTPLWGDWASNVDGEAYTYEHTPMQPYTLAKLAVDYKGLARAANGTLQQQMAPSMTYRTIPPFGFYWHSDGSMVLDKESPAIPEVKLKITRSFQNVRNIPTKFFTLAGHINSNTWTDKLTKMTFKPGTLLYMPTSLDKNITYVPEDDDYLWNLSFELSWNPIGWNSFRRPIAGEYRKDQMMYNGKSYKIFPTASFDGLDYNPAEEFDESAESGQTNTSMWNCYPGYTAWLQLYDGSTFVLEVNNYGTVRYVAGPELIGKVPTV